MRFLSLDLVKFGPFTDVALDFSARPRGFHLIVGSNAVGKSTSLRAVTDLLFGIPETTTDNHLHKNPDLRIRGRVAGEDGEERVLVRRKGRVKTLTDGDDNPVDDAEVRALLGGLGREQFESMFGLSHQGLLKGGRALLEGKGDLGESLFSAGLGGLTIRSVLSGLEERADEIFKPNGQKQALNRAISAFKEAKKTAQERSLQTRDWEKLQEDLRKHEALVVTLEARLRELRAGERRERRIQKALRPTAERAEVQRALDERREVIVLAENAAEERQRVEQVLSEAIPAAARIEDELSELTASRDALTVPDALLARETEVKQLRLDLGSHLKAASDLPRRQTELAALSEEVASLVARLDGSRSIAPLEGLRISDATEARVRSLIASRGKLESNVTHAARRLREERDKLAELGRKLAELPEPRDAGALRRALEPARKEGEIEARIREVGLEVARLRDAAARGLAALGQWSGALAAVGTLAVPTAETIDRFDRSLRALDADLARTGQRAADRRAQLAQIREQLDALELTAAVPSEDDLGAARAAREAIWTRVRGAWVEGARDPEPAPTLAARYEGQVRSADDLADRLRREQGRVAQRAALFARRTAEERAIAEIDQQHATERRERDAESDRFQAIWRAIAVEPLSPVEMKSWLGRYEKLVADKARLGDAERSLADLAARADRHRGALAAALAILDEPPGEAGEGFEALVQRARAAVERVDAAARERDRVRGSIPEREGEAQRIEGELAQHRRDLEAWGAQWQSTMATLGLAPDALPEEVEPVVKLRRELLAKSEEMRKKRLQIEGIEADAAGFAERVSELVRATAPDLEGEPPAGAAAILGERFEKGDKDRLSRAGLTDQIARKTDEQRRLAEKRRLAEQRLGELLAAARCADTTALAAAEARSSEVRALRERRIALEAQLRDLSEGAGIEALIEECRARDADDVFAKLARVEAEIEAAERGRKEPERTIGELYAHLQAMNGNDAAAEAAERAQQELARIRGHVEDYVRVRLASLLLREEINRYRERHQGPVVKRASALFQRLTLGTFGGIEVGYDDTEAPVIRAVRPSDLRVDVDGLSDGTRDQLFLALRLATLELHLDRSPPVPVVLDDLLVNFDDQRARASLEALGELASRTQVLFFTHHRHLTELAAQAIPEGTLVRHDLDLLAGQRLS